MSEVLKDLNARPTTEQIRKDLGTKAEVAKKTKDKETAEIRKLSDILNSRSGKPRLLNVYIPILDCKLKYGDPTIAEFFDIVNKHRDNMPRFIFETIGMMLRKADPELNIEDVATKLEGAESVEILGEMMDASPFFRKLVELRETNKLSLV